MIFNAVKKNCYRGLKLYVGIFKMRAFIYRRNFGDLQILKMNPRLFGIMHIAFSEMRYVVSHNSA